MRMGPPGRGPRWLRLWLCAGTLISCARAKGTYFPRPGPPGGGRYNLYTTGSSPRLREGQHNMLCAYVVQKNVTCILQDGTESYIKAEYHKCSWGPKCPGTVVYRTLLRARYKIGYKTVTELAWRCCQGLRGEGCSEPLPDPGALLPPPRPQTPSGQKPFPGPRVPPYARLPSSPFPGPKSQPYGRKGPGLFGERLTRLEGDVQRLSQSYGTLSGLVAGLGDHLQLAVHEADGRMAGALGNPPTAPEAPVGFGIIPGAVVDPADKAGGPFPTLGEILAKVAEVSDVLKTKTSLLDEVHSLVLGHDTQIKHLLEGARPSPLTSLTLLEEYIDQRLSHLWGDLLDGFEKKLLDLQTTCDFRIKEMQQQCEEEKATSLRLQQSLDGKELEIKKELSLLETQIQGLTMAEDCCSHLTFVSERMDILEKGLHTLAEAQRGPAAPGEGELGPLPTTVLEGFVGRRLQDLEARLNATAGGAGGCCQGLEEGMKGLVGSELDGIRTTVEDRMQTMEDRFMTLVGELGNISSLRATDGAAGPLLQTELAGAPQQTARELAVVESRLTSLESLCAAGSPAQDVATLATEVRDCQSRSRALLLQVDSNAALLHSLNGTVSEIRRQLEEAVASSLQGEITLLKVNLHSVSKSLSGLRDSVSQYSDAVSSVNSSLDERERKVEDEVHSIQAKVSDQGSRLLLSSRQVTGLKGDLERFKARVAGDLGSCQEAAQRAQQEVGHFEQRVAQVERTCGKLGLIAGGLDGLQDDILRRVGGLWGHLGQLNRTLAAHSQEITSLREGLRDCQAKVAELAEHAGPGPEPGEQQEH
ncbi:LOW QUALITY PROTEIN: EMILIN-3 [Sminthopsis crassicaudata]|uniref:LOW QUALITY PROTEIN: EMILIN-3 n=1 Tax=Sminthopsis crassicaudata TaxID=9301 RepID=UPI003D685FD2